MKAKRNVKKIKGQRGNALFLILIAVALFAALSYAITQSGRGGAGGVDRETVVITSGQVVEQPAAIRTAVTRMIITGTSATDITFDAGTNDGAVFSATGGGATDLPPPPAACNTACTAWDYLPAAAGSTGHFIEDVGTDATDAIAFLGDVTPSVCSQILKGLGFASTVPPVQNAADFDESTTGVYAAAGGAATISDNDVLKGQPFACWDQDKDGGGEFAYYHALIEQ